MLAMDGETRGFMLVLTTGNLCGYFSFFRFADCRSGNADNCLYIPPLLFIYMLFYSELCTRYKKVFAHEHALYPPNWLPSHLPSMYRPPNYKPPKDQIEGGVHPLCQFCRECFFGDDELYKHMRENHEECLLCNRNEVRDQ